MRKFDDMSEQDIAFLIEEMEFFDLEGIPPQGSRQWYLMEFAHWVLGEIIAGRSPL